MAVRQDRQVGDGRRVGGRLAFIKTELAIRDDQTAEWDAFAAMVRENAENHNGLMQSMMERMWGDGYADTPLPQRLKEHEGFMTARLAQIQDMRAAVEALYAVLDEDQKKSADEIMMPAMGMGMGMGMAMGSQMAGALTGATQPAAAQQAPPLPGAATAAGTEYTVAINDEKYGPYDLNHLQKMADDGSFKPDMLVWAKGMGAWTKASEVAELSDLFGPPPLPAAGPLPAIAIGFLTERPQDDPASRPTSVQRQPDL